MNGIDAAKRIRSLSAGTIGTLTGLKSYRAINAKREDNAVCVQYSVRQFNGWMEAWQWIEKQNNEICRTHNEY